MSLSAWICSCFPHMSIWSMGDRFAGSRADTRRRRRYRIEGESVLATVECVSRRVYLCPKPLPLSIGVYAWREGKRRRKVCDH
jgi:hypothetical protein